MIKECQKCGSLYNNKTVQKCPACYPCKEKTTRSEIDKYAFESIGSKKKLSNSSRKSQQATYERVTGKKIF